MPPFAAAIFNANSRNETASFGTAAGRFGAKRGQIGNGKKKPRQPAGREPALSRPPGAARLPRAGSRRRARPRSLRRWQSPPAPPPAAPSPLSPAVRRGAAPARPLPLVQGRGSPACQRRQQQPPLPLLLRLQPTPPTPPSSSSANPTPRPRLARPGLPRCQGSRRLPPAPRAAHTSSARRPSLLPTSALLLLTSGSARLKTPCGGGCGGSRERGGSEDGGRSVRPAAGAALPLGAGGGAHRAAPADPPRLEFHLPRRRRGAARRRRRSREARPRRRAAGAPAAPRTRRPARQGDGRCGRGSGCAPGSRRFSAARGARGSWGEGGAVARVPPPRVGASRRRAGAAVPVGPAGSRRPRSQPRSRCRPTAGAPGAAAAADAPGCSFLLSSPSLISSSFLCPPLLSSPRCPFGSARSGRVSVPNFPGGPPARHGPEGFYFTATSYFFPPGNRTGAILYCTALLGPVGDRQ